MGEEMGVVLVHVTNLTSCDLNTLIQYLHSQSLAHIHNIVSLSRFDVTYSGSENILKEKMMEDVTFVI